MAHENRGGRIFGSRHTLSSVDSSHANHPAQVFPVRSDCCRSSDDQDYTWGISGPT